MGVSKIDNNDNDVTRDIGESLWKKPKKLVFF